MNIQAFPWACVSLALLSSNAGADVILSDDFNYTNGVLQTVSSGKWAGHSGTTNQVDTSNGALNLNGSESQDVSALLAGQPFATTNGLALYVGFGLRITALPSGTGSYFAHFKDAGAGFRGRIWALTNGAGPGSFRLGIGSGSGTAPTVVHSTDLKTDADHRIVCRLALSNSVAALWVDPDSETDDRVSSDAASAIAVSAFAFRQASGIGTLRIDNLVAGTVWTDVVPPSQAPPPPSPAQTPIAVPIITLQPKSQTVVLGSDASFSTEAQSLAPLRYQWQFNDSDLAGATNAVLTLSRVTSGQEGDYRVIARNASGPVTSTAARLTVIAPQPPRISTPPASVTVEPGQTALFAVAATGSTPMNYHWKFNGAKIPDATSSTLTLNNVEPRHAGEYTVTVSNGDGSVESPAALLKVQVPVVVVPPDPFRPPSVRFTNYLANLVRPGDLPTNTFAEHAIRPGEKLTMQVLVSSADDLPVTIAEDSTGLPASARWTIAETTGWNLTAMFTFTPSAVEAGSNFVVSLHAVTTSSTNVNTWAIYVPTDREQRVVVSEFLANPSVAETAPHFNPMRRAEPAPNPTWHDEFVEIVNASNHEMDLSNWTISDSTAVRHRFPEEYGLQAWGAIIVYGGPKIGFAPGLSVPSIWVNVSEAGLGLNNTGVDAILLRNAQGRLISRVVYPPLSTSGSMTRHPTLDGGFVSHASVSTNSVSPGVNYDGHNFSELVGALVAPVVLGVVLEQGGKAVLTWSAEAGRDYSVVRADSLTGTFAPVATGLRFAGGVGRHVVENQEQNATRFFKVSTP